MELQTAAMSGCRQSLNVHAHVCYIHTHTHAFTPATAVVSVVKELCELSASLASESKFDSVNLKTLNGSHSFTNKIFNVYLKAARKQISNPNTHQTCQQFIITALHGREIHKFVGNTQKKTLPHALINCVHSNRRDDCNCTICCLVLKAL